MANRTTYHLVTKSVILVTINQNLVSSLDLAKPLNLLPSIFFYWKMWKIFGFHEYWHRIQGLQQRGFWSMKRSWGLCGLCHRLPAWPCSGHLSSASLFCLYLGRDASGSPWVAKSLRNHSHATTWVKNSTEWLIQPNLDSQSWTSQRRVPLESIKSHF